jgi:DNA-binding PadR family transcriptional regulator
MKVVEVDVLDRLHRREWRTALEIAERLDAERGESLMTRPSVYALLYLLLSSGVIESRLRRPQQRFIPEHEFRLTQSGRMRRCDEPRIQPLEPMLQPI